VAAGTPPRFWPSIGSASFSSHPVDDGRCVGCGEILALLLPPKLLAGADGQWRPFSRGAQVPSRSA
jgi:hypothetical protein